MDNDNILCYYKRELALTQLKGEMMKNLISFLLVVALMLTVTTSPAGQWYPVLIHTHTTNSDGGNIASALAAIIINALSGLRPDGKCAWVNTDHFDGVARDFDHYTESITSCNISGKFIAIPGLEVGSKWRPELNTWAGSHIVALGHVPANFRTLLDCYDLNTSGEGLPLLDRFDKQQQEIKEILAMGMLPVAAHPTQLVFGGPVVRRDNRFNMKSDHEGLRGVEMYNVVGLGQDDECVNWYLRMIASGLPVFVTSGSDYHGTNVSSVVEGVLGSLDRITWVYADDFSEASILRAISEGKTFAVCEGAFLADFLGEGGQNPGLAPTSVDQMTITAFAWLTGSQVKIIVYRDGVEATRQEYKGSLTQRSLYNLNGGDDFQNGWTDTAVAPDSVHTYVVRVLATTKLGEQTLLITSPITLRLRPTGQTTAFFDAIKAKNLAGVEEALAADPSLANARDLRDNYNFQVHTSKPLALSVACRMGTTEIVRCLLEHRAQPDAYLGAGEPGPLMECAYTGDIEKTKLILDHGGNVNIRSDGNTPLVWALGGSFVELAKYLIERGADINLAGDSKRRPLTIAKGMNLTEIVDLLTDKGAKE